MPKQTHLAYTLSAALMIGTSSITGAFANESSLDIKFTGALEFAEDGTLFVGDNYSGAVYAFEVPAEESLAQISPSSIANIDTKIAELLGVGVGAIEINDMAVHPVSQDIYISITRIGNYASQPALVIVSQEQQISLLDMSSLAFQKQELTEYPSVKDYVALNYFLVAHDKELSEMDVSFLARRRNAKPVMHKRSGEVTSSGHPLFIIFGYATN